MISNVRNVLFFGETGVGKSSLINMIMEGHISATEGSHPHLVDSTNVDSKRAPLRLDTSNYPTNSDGLEPGVNLVQSPTNIFSTILHPKKTDVRKRDSCDVTRSSIGIGDQEHSPTACSRRESLPYATVSSQAKGCTFKSESYQTSIDGLEYKMWDTVGLNEGDLGRAPAAKAMEALGHLVHEVAEKEGINLLVYCIRANRITQASTKNYRVFYSALCRKKVPIVIVILGLEHFQGESMDNWWEQNEKDFKRHRMFFSGSACVTATRGHPTQDGTYPYEDRYRESQLNVRKLISKQCSPQAWKVSPNRALQVIQDIVGLTQKMEEDNPTIYIHDFSRGDSTAAIQNSCFSITTRISGEPIATTLASVVIIGGKRYTLHDAETYDRSIDLSKTLEKEPCLLIFCLAEGQVGDTVPRCKKVYKSNKCDGNNIPLLVVIIPQVAVDGARSIDERRDIIEKTFKDNSISVASYTGLSSQSINRDENYGEGLWSCNLPELIARFTLELSAKDPGVLKSLWKNVLNVMRRSH